MPKRNGCAKESAQAFDPHQDIKPHSHTHSALAGESEREKGRNRKSRIAKRNEGSKHAKNVQKQQHRQIKRISCKTTTLGKIGEGEREKKTFGKFFTLIIRSGAEGLVVSECESERGLEIEQGDGMGDFFFLLVLAQVRINDTCRRPSEI